MQKGAKGKKKKYSLSKKENYNCFFLFQKPLSFGSTFLYFYPEIMNCVRIGILDAAIEIAFLATFSATPPIS